VKKLALICCLFLLPPIAAAVENGQVLYVGGTIPSLREGSLGRLDTSSESALVFASGAAPLVIPFSKIESYEYSQDVARHLGLLPAIGAGLLRKRQHKHFFRITYRDSSEVLQVTVFEVPKQMPRSLLAVLQTRAPQGCQQPNRRCVLTN
jgi:hypothetical protein